VVSAGDLAALSGMQTRTIDWRGVVLTLACFAALLALTLATRPAPAPVTGNVVTSGPACPRCAPPAGR
jgi:hypothetical protein